jgi:8-oxo-dGTP diphosphatase
MMSCKWIEKVGLAALDDGRLLVVRKHGGTMFILPGGKPEGTEGDLAALTRELDEELGCSVSSPSLSGVFTDRAAGVSDAVVVVRLYQGNLVGNPIPQAEIEELAWLDIRKPDTLPLAPSIVNGILPHLRKTLRRAARLSKPQPQVVQGLLELV